jgi:polyhydroxyalkanoate synthesis regulator phasin
MELPKAANDAAPVERLVQELIDTGAMTEETVADLERMRDEFRAGTLSADDADYLVALHRRITEAPAVEEVLSADEAADLKGELEAALARAEAAEAEVTALREELAALKAAAGE